MKNLDKLIFIFCFTFALNQANAQTTDTFNYTGSTQTFVVPACVDQVTVQLWSGGGAGGNWNSFSGYDFSGGSGSYYSGVISGISPGQTITLYVPSGGQYSSFTAGGLGGWPGGGQGGNDINFGEEGGGGGGYAAIQIGGTYYVVAGAGGGGGSWPGYECYGGGGGATTGGNGGSGGYYLGGGQGGTITTGGSVGYSSDVCDPATAGAYLAGGMGGGMTCSGDYGGGGGGAGYYGGGGGGDYGSGGGGGSSYPGSTITIAGITFTPTSNLQGNGSDYYDSIAAPGSPPLGIGTGGYEANGGAGMITLTWAPGFIPVTNTGNVVSNVTCYEANNGIASAIVTGGTPSTYTYSWAPSGGSSDTAFGLSIGSYTVTVNNNCGGSATASVTITQPTILNASASITANVSCYGGNNGIAFALASGGTSPYTYSWTNGETNFTATGLSAGIYRVTVTDNNGCNAIATVNITQPNMLVANTNVVSNESCGLNNGSASSTVGGGTTPYTYSWTGGSTNSSASGLSGGAYTLTVTDNNGCIATSSVMLAHSPAVSVSASTLENIACNGDNIGSASSNVLGGTSPFAYLWSGGGGTNFTAANLAAGTYTVTVTDVNGCTSSATTTITQPTPIAVIADSTPADNGCSGSAWIIVSGGSSPYNYLWSNGNTTDYLSNECKGEYCCTITDAHGCVKSVCIRVTSTTGINTITSGGDQVIVYPNPNNGQFTISAPGVSGKSIVEIYNILGEKVYTTGFNSTQGDNVINIANQSNGIYLYRVITESGTMLGEGKIILQK